MRCPAFAVQQQLHATEAAWIWLILAIVPVVYSTSG